MSGGMVCSRCGERPGAMNGASDWQQVAMRLEDELAEARAMIDQDWPKLLADALEQRDEARVRLAEFERDAMEGLEDDREIAVQLVQEIERANKAEARLTEVVAILKRLLDEVPRSDNGGFCQTCGDIAAGNIGHEEGCVWLAANALFETLLAAAPPGIKEGKADA